ncbi:hypothetical protein B0H13DRAFT_1916994 [Mycena leptocephala]|nr:hypothetical protein B0H13DRAFT_1916994 [Mycena leptocephala]
MREVRARDAQGRGGDRSCYTRMNGSHCTPTRARGRATWAYSTTSAPRGRRRGGERAQKAASTRTPRIRRTQNGKCAEDTRLSVGYPSASWNKARQQAERARMVSHAAMGAAGARGGKVDPRMRGQGPAGEGVSAMRRSNVRCGEQADAAGVDVIRTCKERRKAGDAPKASAEIEFRETGSARWVQSDAVKDYDNESLCCSSFMTAQTDLPWRLLIHTVRKLELRLKSELFSETPFKLRILLSWRYGYVMDSEKFALLESSTDPIESSHWNINAIPTMHQFRTAFRFSGHPPEGIHRIISILKRPTTYLGTYLEPSTPESKSIDTRPLFCPNIFLPRHFGQDFSNVQASLA